MRRAPFVIGATGVGLGLLFSYHTKPLHLSIASSAGVGAAGGGSSPTTPTTPGPSTPPATTGPSGGSTSNGTSAPSATTTPPTTAAATRTGTGQDVQYRYGDIQLRVTEKGSRITNIQILSDGAADPRSEEINSQALPVLQQEALSAQSANIDGVSGATFTSQAYAYALQSALDQLR